MEPFILKARPGTAISTLTQALALLPEGLNVGDRLRREFFDYEKI